MIAAAGQYRYNGPRTGRVARYIVRAVLPENIGRHEKTRVEFAGYVSARIAGYTCIIPGRPYPSRCIDRPRISSVLSRPMQSLQVNSLPIQSLQRAVSYTADIATLWDMRVIPFGVINRI